MSVHRAGDGSGSQHHAAGRASGAVPLARADGQHAVLPRRQGTAGEAAPPRAGQAAGGAWSAGAHELESGMSGAPVCSDTMGTPPRRSDSGWLQMFMKSPRMTSAWNACGAGRRACQVRADIPYRRCSAASGELAALGWRRPAELRGVCCRRRCLDTVTWEGVWHHHHKLPRRAVASGASRKQSQGAQACEGCAQTMRRVAFAAGRAPGWP